MTDKPARLGRGLAALIGDMGSLETARVTEGTASGKRLPLDFIIANRANPRRTFDPEQLEELANSIREKGVMSPLLVRPTDDPNIFELIAGERRWRAAQMAGLHDVPVIVREVGDKEALELAIIENVQRADLNPLEEAMGYGQLIEQFSYTQQDLAQVIGKSRSHVANTLRLLRLPEDVRGMVASGTLTAGHARTLITVEDPAALARRIVENGLSVRDAEALSQQRETAGPKRKSQDSERDPDTVALERRLADVLGLSVAVNYSGRGGKLEIRYKSLEQLDDLCRRLTGSN
ncbi:ParB/RepB/Spo0J family partition protein [Devosia sp. PTR5]|uniref:ParB/RepB/Spo0J family partition protein n=1 Tax=Devosia oryzisoli TaxID=2774138 RepID=A0A927FV04_9HYPH|nr:ParB/RepB/Spo0J family partition protein [Devosia oryzisoli]MBD8066491.1 ParB/RepB/Spo0J family partition protein [Devosia oryzisoli]